MAKLLRKGWVLIGLLILLMVMTGCVPGDRLPDTLQERAENRQECEALGGHYNERRNGMTYVLVTWECELDSEDDRG